VSGIYNPGSGAAGAPADAQYVTLATNATLTVERVLTAGDGIALADAGAGSTVTASVDVSPLTDGGRGLFDSLALVELVGGAIRKHTLEGLIGYLTIGHPRRRFSVYLDFTGEPNASAGDVLIENNTGSGASTSGGTTNATNRVGVIRSGTGTTTTGRAAMQTATLSTLALGAGPAVFELALNVTTLSAVAERYHLIAGFFDTNAADQVDAVAFVYDEGGVSTGSAASANWQLYTSSNSTRTWTTTSTAVPAATWTTLRIEVNADGTSVEFFVDNVSVGTHTTNIPTGTARVVGFGWQILKSLGTTSRTIDADYIAVEVDFTTPR
jgi:hypothetical protein